MSLSICTPLVGREMFSIENNKPVGYLASTFSSVLQIFQTQFKNCTMYLSERFGDITDETEQRYDGCIGDLQQGNVDLAMMPADFPMLAPNISSTTTIMSSTTTILSSYNSYDSSKTDVTDAFSSFDSTVWLIVLIAVTILVSLLVFVKSVTTGKKKNKSCRRLFVKIFVAAIFKQFSSFNMNVSKFTARFTYLMILIFVFEILFFFSSMIKTEMVVQEKPDTISTYEEMLEHPNTNPVWLKAHTTHWEFKNADKDSAAGKIWQKALKMGLDKCFQDVEFGILLSLMQGIAKKEIVWLIPSYAVKPVVTNICAFSRANAIMTDVNMWFKTDPAAGEKLLVLLRSSKTSKETSSKLDTVTRRMIEHDVVEEIWRRSGFAVTKDTGKSEVKSCVGNRVIHPEHAFEPVNLSHFSGLWIILSVGWSLAGIVFSIQIIVRSIQKLVFVRYVLTFKRFQF